MDSSDDENQVITNTESERVSKKGGMSPKRRNELIKSL